MTGGVLAHLWLFPTGAVAGLAGAVAMDVPMRRQPEGWTPARVAAAVIRRRPPEWVRFRTAALVHHAAGVLAGLLYALLVLPFALVGIGPTVGRVPLVGHVAAVVTVVAFVYAFFAYLLLPRVGADVSGERATAVRGQWLRSSVVFGVVLAVVVPLLGVTV